MWALGTNSNLKFLSITSTMGKSGFATLGGRAPSISPESRNGRNRSILSNARLQRRSQLFGRRGQCVRCRSNRVGIARLVRTVVVHTHASQSPATVRRYAIASNAGLRVKRSSSIIDHNAQWRFTKDGRRCGIGFEIEADALCFVMNLPASPSSALCGADSAIQRAARTARFIWEAQYGPALAGVADNVFLRNWLAQVFQSQPSGSRTGARLAIRN